MSFYKNSAGGHTQCRLIKLLNNGMALINVEGKEQTVCQSTLTFL